MGGRIHAAIVIVFAKFLKAGKEPVPDPPVRIVAHHGHHKVAREDGGDEMDSFTPDNTDTGRTCSKELPVRLRRLSDLKFKTLGFTERRFRPYVIAIGEATLSWNDFHETMGQLFWEICLSKCPEPMDVWQVVRNDLTNREMLKAPAAAEMKIQPRDDAVFADVKWIYDRSNELEHDRNNIIHSLPRSSKRTDKVLPATAFNKPRGKALKGKDILKEYRRLRDTAILLRDFCFKIGQAMGDDNRPWPERPRLPGRAVAKIPPPHPKAHPAKLPPPPYRGARRRSAPSSRSADSAPATARRYS